ncbi:MAG: tRNA nucleotidyltransferase, partial [Bacteroidetes bacterium]
MNFKETLSQAVVFELLAQSGQQLNVPTYLVGGLVRDWILERPCTDIDVVCVGSGIVLAEKFAELYAQKYNYKPEVSVFKNFGTAMCKAGEWQVEFVGARRESYQRDSRKPIVEDGTLEDDQNRRDFTINAMAISL